MFPMPYILGKVLSFIRNKIFGNITLKNMDSVDVMWLFCVSFVVGLVIFIIVGLSTGNITFDQSVTKEHSQATQ